MRYLKERGIQMYFEIENVNSFDSNSEAVVILSGALGHERQLIICYAEKERCQICEFE